MRASDWIAIVYFTYVFALAWTLRLPRARRWQIAGAAAATLATLSAAATFPATSWWRSWLPGVILIVAYKLSGRFFTAPMPAFEQALAASDRWLFERFGLGKLVAHTPRVVLEYLEACYLLAVPLVPAGLVVALRAGDSAAVERFWTLGLAVEFVCFGMLPWIQTRPPWVREPPSAVDARALAMRRANRLFVDRALMPVNTFPSGHAATALAVALATFPAAPAVGALFLVLAVSVAVGSVIGRYHYALDALAGIILTLLIWIMADV